MKRRLKIFAALAAAACITVTAAGCGSSPRNLASLRSNWYADTTFRDIQPTFMEDGYADYAENIVYSIEKTGGNNAYYSVEYTGGIYETTFKAVTFDVENLTHEQFRPAYVSAAENRAITAYYYKTERSFEEVKYTCNGNSESFTDDCIVTECYFLASKDYLRPLYSRQVIKSTTPANLQSGSLDSSYLDINREQVSYYSYSGGLVITEIIDHAASDAVTTTHNDALNSEANSVFDVCELEILIRAMNNFSASLSQTVALYTPGRGGTGLGNYTLTGSSTGIAAEQLTSIETVLQGKNLFKPVITENDDGTTTSSHLSTLAVSVAYNGSLSGVSQTYWFAAVTNARNNTGRATMLKKTEPLTYNLGTLEYVIKEINSTFWAE